LAAGAGEGEGPGGLVRSGEGEETAP